MTFVWPLLEDGLTLDSLIGIDGTIGLEDGGDEGSGTSPPPPPPVTTGRGKPFLRRDPTVDRREGRNWEILTDMINSLLSQGYIVETSKGVWQLFSSGFVVGGLTGTFTDSFP